jgi:signal transduction histidine kinase
MGSATNRRCPIELTLDKKTAGARGDEAVVRHILTNLLSNAVKYSPAGQPVELTVGRDRAMAEFRITDRGCGIPLADQARIFQAFHRGSNVRQIHGTGLGLLIVRRCVDLHGGEIAFDSVEGKGTTFTVRLPLFAAARRSASAAKKSKPRPKRNRRTARKK